MLVRSLIRDRALVAVAAMGLLIAVVYLVDGVPGAGGKRLTGAQHLLTAQPWYCEVHDPDGGDLVARSVETFHEGGILAGRTTLEDRKADRVLLEFSYEGVWQFEDPFLTESINEYRYLHVDDAAFSPEELAAIEAEFAEPEISRVHALTEGQLVYGVHRSLYQCRRQAGVTNV